jgi:exopolysaccharide production protein ExoY
MAHYSEVERGRGSRVSSRIEAGAQNRGGLYQRYLKRGLDVVLVLLAGPFILVLVIFLGMLIRRDGGPVFYCQDRIGLNGQVFRFWKLRSMVVDADARLAVHIAADPAARTEWERHQKLRNDPRVTPFGRFLRRTSLDELPQLWNVLRGDMSLVGPRPMMPEQRRLYPGEAYYDLRPGLTGFWQIRERNQVSFADRAGHDTLYAERLSFVTDIMVLLMTVRAVLGATGR